MTSAHLYETIALALLQPFNADIPLLQVYAFGPVSIVMDTTQGMVRAHLKDRWVPVSLDQLVQEAASRHR